MGISERREREKERRRNEIIESAERVFFSKGWTVATMDDVAADAELSKATLYLYFKSKEELYVAILVRGSRILNSMFEEAVRNKENGLLMSEAIGRAYVSFFYEYPDYFNALTYFESKGFDIDETNEYARECESLRDGTMGLVAGSIQAGIDDGSIRPDIDPMQTALILWAQTTGVLQILSAARQDIESRHSIETSELVETYFSLTFRALASDSDAGSAGGRD
jgi:AcrR family transcriptional regulator